MSGSKKMTDVTFVSALFNIDRVDGRKWDEYLKWFDITLKLQAPMTLFVTEDLVEFVQKRRDGTGKFALVNGVSVGGKTGTSKKAEMGSYSDNKVITSFIGVFPSENPKFLTFVLFDEPETNINNSPDNTGGNTAAPTFSKIVKKISPIIDINNYF